MFLRQFPVISWQSAAIGDFVSLRALCTLRQPWCQNAKPIYVSVKTEAQLLLGCRAFVQQHQPPMPSQTWSTVEASDPPLLWPKIKSVAEGLIETGDISGEQFAEKFYRRVTAGLAVCEHDVQHVMI